MGIAEWRAPCPGAARIWAVRDAFSQFFFERTQNFGAQLQFEF